MDVIDVPAVSVVIAAFSMERWDMLRAAVSSVQAQSLEALEIVVVIDHNPVLLARVNDELTGVRVVPNAASQGASGARNSGVAVSKGDFVAFLDDDAVADSGWLKMLLRHFADPHVVGVGGQIIPRWAGPRPRWFPREFDWAVGGSYRGMPEEPAPVRNVWSGNMVIRRTVFDSIEGFRVGFGKVGKRSRPEDTDLCLRATATSPGGIWIYEPAGVVHHHVPGNRATLSFFLRRCLAEGSGKAALAALNGRNESTSAERYYTRRVLPRAVIRGLVETARGDAAGSLRSVAIVAGLLCAVGGFLIGRVSGEARSTILVNAKLSEQLRSKDANSANSR